MATRNSTLVPAQEQDQYDHSAPPLWEAVAKLGEAVSVEEWDRVPTDLAANLDQHLYRATDES